MRPVVRDGRVRDIETTLRYGGELRDCLVSAELTEFEGERCIIAITRDITERKRAETQLRASEAKFRAFAESSQATMTVSGASST